MLNSHHKLVQSNFDTNDIKSSPALIFRTCNNGRNTRERVLNAKIVTMNYTVIGKQLWFSRFFNLILNIQN